ncbi:FeoB-associated Cys-rich membrane protein [Niameybacter massiliensis]|uniref:FeoB-associated Cys-rich membrane protein n=1 Tax=Holtiella tumoricola TaxID=3018743 RepID=A0AA42DKE1_9FIRM|nr:MULTISPECIES: FeoB-associated Cys-rich membrane protein [Lachnospirales]MDA3730574.1 FeoB-associated Cys-rich membrane protein [Holtiella tumoricola]
MADFIIIGIIVLLMAGASYKIYRDKKNNPCGCGCSGCAQKSCPSKHQAKDKDK